MSLASVVGDLVLKDLPMVCFVVGPDDRVLTANRHTRELLGRAVVGERFAELLVTFEAPQTARALAPGGLRRLNFRTFTGLPITFSCAFSTHGEDVVIVGGEEPRESETLRKELLQANQRLSATTRDLQKANATLTRLGETKDRFLGMAAHDLRSPLMAILAYARMLREEGLPAETRDDVESLVSAAELTQRIVDGFLDLSVIQSGRLRIERAPIALGRVVDAALAVVRPAAERHEVALEVSVQPGALSADGPKLEQVIVNLVNNAIQHSPPGGVVSVRARVVDGHAEIAVVDRGPGIPPELKADLFTAYSHGPEARNTAERSIGLGLAIGRVIARGHGGELTLEGEPGEGTTARLRIPVAGTGQALV